MDIMWILILIFTACFIVFLGLAFFLPEWVGISRPNPHRDGQPKAGQTSETSKENKSLT